MPDDVISRINALAQNYPMGITFTDRNEKEIKEYDDNNDYVPSEEEDIKEYGYYHPADGPASDSGDDYQSDDDGPDPHFGTAPNGNDKPKKSHETTEEEDPKDNTVVGIKKLKPKTT